MPLEEQHIDVERMIQVTLAIITAPRDTAAETETRILGILEKEFKYLRRSASLHRGLRMLRESQGVMGRRTVFTRFDSVPFSSFEGYLAVMVFDQQRPNL